MGLRVAAVLAALLFGCLLPASAPRAQGSLSGTAESSPVITAIDVIGTQRIEDETVRSYMKIVPGDRYDPALIDQSLKSLYATGLFADVTIRLEGSVVVVNVVENPIINRLAFEGNHRVRDDLLNQEVRLRPRVVYTRSRVQADVQRILQVYRRNGRFAVTVDPKVIQLPQNRVDLVFEINEGPITGIRRIDFINNRVFDDSELRGVIATKESAWYRFFSNADTYDPDRLTLDRELLRKFYLEHGYADFRVASAVAELTEDRKDFFITFTVEEGERYDFGKIDLKTTLRNLDPETLRSAITTQSGEVYNADEIQRTIEALTFRLGEKGYAFVDIRPRVQRHRDSRKIDVTYEIKEGPKVFVERINITGNVRTLDKVIRREMQLVEGDAFNTAKLRRSRQAINRLGFFDKVDITQHEGSSPDQAILDVDVQERSTGELSFGVGVSTSEAVLGDIQLRERNLLGRGQDLRLGLSLSATRQQIDLSFTEPYFMDRNVAAGFDVFKINRDLQDQSSFDQESVGGRLRSNFPITEHLRQGVNYTLRQDKITNVDTDTSPLIALDEGTFVTSSVGYNLTYDTRDDLFQPNSGVLIRGAQDLAGLGGDVKYIRTTATWSWFYPFSPDYVGNLALRAGHIASLGEDLRVTDRFFIGGDSFRGFQTGGIGPRDSNTGDSVGGTVYYVATGELRFPVGLPNDFGIVGRAFTEVGTLTDAGISGPGLVDSKNPRVSVGFGLSWSSPFGPIRIDIAKPVVKESFDKDELFRFSFGTRF